MSDQSIKFVSDRRKYYQKLKPVLWAVFIAYLIGVIMIYAAFSIYTHNFPLAVYLLVVSLVLCSSLLIFTYNLIKEISCDYALEIAGQDVIFSKFDHWRKKRSEQMLLLTDIKYAEYYPYQDSASIIFHTSYIDIDLPLWPLGNQWQDVIDFLEGAGVKVVNVQSDEPIPKIE